MITNIVNDNLWMGLHCSALYVDVLDAQRLFLRYKSVRAAIRSLFRSLWRFLEEIKNAVHLLVRMQGS